MGRRRVSSKALFWMARKGVRHGIHDCVLFSFFFFGLALLVNPGNGYFDFFWALLLLAWPVDRFNIRSSCYGHATDAAVCGYSGSKESAGEVTEFRGV